MPYSDSWVRQWAHRGGLWRDTFLGDMCAYVLLAPPGGNSYHRYEKLRERGDLVRSRRGLALTASHALSREILGNDQMFGSVPMMVTRRDKGQTDSWPVHPIDDAFVTLDPPRHTLQRDMATPWTTPAAIRELAPVMESDAAELLDRMPQDHAVDVVSQYIEPFIATALSRLLGLPVEDIRYPIRWGRIMSEALDGPRLPLEAHRERQMCTEMTDYFQDRFMHPHEENGRLVTDLAQKVQAGQCSMRDAIAVASSMLGGGMVNPVSLVGNVILSLLRNPDQLEKARPNYTAAIDESLRYETTVQYLIRRTSADTELAGQHLPARTPLVVLIAAANRDPGVFDHPHVFDVTRPNLHQAITFGTGIHACPGSLMTRQQTRIALRLLFARYPRIRVAGKPRYRRSTGQFGVIKLPVHLG